MLARPAGTSCRLGGLTLNIVTSAAFFAGKEIRMKVRLTRGSWFTFSVIATLVAVLALAGDAWAAGKRAPTTQPAGVTTKVASSTTQPAPKSGGWMTKHEKYLARAKEGNIDLLFLGDSITEGWGNNEVWKKYYGELKAANFGISGDQTQNVLWRLLNGEIDGISPKAAVLMIGTNNSGGSTAEQVADGVTAIVKTLREKLPNTKVLLLAIFPRGEKPNPQREKIQKANETIAKLDDGKMVRYLDIGPKFVDKDGVISKEVMPDFLHLSKKGYEIWAESTQPLLAELMELKKEPPKEK
jgi:lysophospholipase L1-like esterase